MTDEELALAADNPEDSTQFLQIANGLHVHDILLSMCTEQ